jgi:hypothetical protein
MWDQRTGALPPFWIAVVKIEFNARQATAARKPIGGEGVLQIRA